ncbi:class I SAM-dependent methyltransferase [Candidatus Xianfuyuplasma coldseepsis]|uniref:Methyltransferase domain-containing protein n=1 Tax=Candidatus Xianfuyuplasma coldseepsis TaxID=2782163 RepID=A0A7L7KQN4_9MOLU|nr:class I SAM-dependent methyltransferase [Xianfuyuplasma coldseepsis]QMS85130.1 methyltransferase domain-containing protein [Xianfuyuplasma coldseepsis]
MNRLKEFLESTQKKTFLDIGTGTGNFIHQITSMYEEYESFIGIDTSARLIEMATKHTPNDKVSFIEMDAYDMTFPDNHFDVVCLSNSLHHLSNIPQMFQAMKRVLKEDGYILIQEMIKDQLSEMQQSHKLMHHFAARIDRLSGDTHYETFTEQEIIDILGSQEGLSIDQEWILDVPRHKENSKEELDYIYNILERVMSRVPEDHQEEFIKEKEQVKQYIEKHGYDGCPSVFAVLKKQ